MVDEPVRYTVLIRAPDGFQWAESDGIPDVEEAKEKARRFQRTRGDRYDVLVAREEGFAKGGDPIYRIKKTEQP